MIVLDNHPIHKVKMVKKITDEYGMTLLYLPPYSPDFNPIEQTWSVAKSHIKKDLTSINSMEEKIRYVLDNYITSEITSSQIRHAGYWDWDD